MPQAVTSIALESGKFLVKMNSKSSGSVQLLTFEVFTLTVVLAGTSVPSGEDTRASRNLTVSWALTSAAMVAREVGLDSSVVKDTWAFDWPENATEGIPSFAASHAAPLQKRPGP